MTDLQTALLDIEKFWPKPDPKLVGHEWYENVYQEFTMQGKHDNSEALKRIQAEFHDLFPNELQDYIVQVCDQKGVTLDTVGNPLNLLPLHELKFIQDGYNYNPVLKEDIDGWPAHYFMIANEAGDPYFIDLKSGTTQVEMRIHGSVGWDYGDTVADNIAQFLLCACYQHAMLNHPDFEIIDDERGFNLVDSVAKWYFPQMKKYAGQYYSFWCESFQNA